MSSLALAPGIPVKSGDTLTLALASRTTDLFRCNVQIVDREGHLFPLTIEATGTGDRLLTSTSTGIPFDGVLASAIVEPSTNADVGPGTAFTDLHLFRQSRRMAGILRGYIYGGHVPSFPGLQEGLVDGEGRIVVTTTANPAANAEVAAITVPTNTRWRLLSYTVSMAQGITQTPVPNLRIRDSAATLRALIPIGATIAASTTVQCTWARAAASSLDNAAGGSIQASIGDDFLNQGSTIDTLTRGLGAGSDYGAATLVAEEWINRVANDAAAT